MMLLVCSLSEVLAAVPAKRCVSYDAGGQPCPVQVELLRSSVPDSLYAVVTWTTYVCRSTFNCVVFARHFPFHFAGAFVRSEVTSEARVVCELTEKI